MLIMMEARSAPRILRLTLLRAATAVTAISLVDGDLESKVQDSQEEDCQLTRDYGCRSKSWKTCEGYLKLLPWQTASLMAAGRKSCAMVTDRAHHRKTSLRPKETHCEP